MYSSDIGSMPSRIKTDIIRSGARKANSLLPFLGVRNEDYVDFEEVVVSSFIDKLKVGVDVPNYPQFRDMNEMFFELMDGIERIDGALHAVNGIRAKPRAAIPETEALRREARKIKSSSGRDRVRIKVCVTGPYTLSSFFQFKTPGLYLELAEALADILEASLFSNGSAEISHLSMDEPVLGFMNDPLLDYGSDGREALRKAWDKVLYVAKSRGVDTSMHLHDTSENLFWDAENLDVVASHVGDPLYSQESVKKRLEGTDKRLWVAIGITQFDTLIENFYVAQGFTGNIPEKIGEVWTGMRKATIDPYIFLEDTGLMRKRLDVVSEFFGRDRLAYVSPECGLGSFPEYEVAIECLERTSSVVAGFNSCNDG
jgi:5-methyltetrahydropteroyltriglutamate--homocysteine methyltransferase